jgi:hypothetical protein
VDYSLFSGTCLGSSRGLWKPRNKRYWCDGIILPAEDCSIKEDNLEEEIVVFSVLMISPRTKEE